MLSAIILGLNVTYTVHGPEYGTLILRSESNPEYNA